jgi:hypothetical protein
MLEVMSRYWKRWLKTLREVVDKAIKVIARFMDIADTL